MPKHLHPIITTLYISSALILSRTIYRTVEYFAAAQIHVVPSFDPMSISPIIRYEWFCWVFEATLMLSNTLLLNFRHPAMYLPRSNKIYPAEDGATEIKGPEFEDKRNFAVTIVDPRDLSGLIRGRDMKERYWEGHEGVLPNRMVEMTPSPAAAVASTEVEEKQKMAPWICFKKAFLSDRGSQGREVQTSAQGGVVDGNGFKNVDLEKNAPRLHPGMQTKMAESTYVGPTSASPAMAGSTTSSLFI